MDDLISKVEQKILDATAIAFNSEPLIKTIYWTQTTGEFNDSGYDGFKIGPLRVTYSTPMTLKDWQGEEYQVPEDEPVELDDIPAGEVQSLLDAVHQYIQATSQYWEMAYDNRTKFVIDREEGFSTSYYDSY
jgi:hypothetical protein